MQNRRLVAPVAASVLLLGSIVAPSAAFADEQLAPEQSSTSEVTTQSSEEPTVPDAPQVVEEVIVSTPEPAPVVEAPQPEPVADPAPAPEQQPAAPAVDTPKPSEPVEGPDAQKQLPVQAQQVENVEQVDGPDSAPAVLTEPEPELVVDTEKPVVTLEAAPSVFNSNNVDLVIQASDNVELAKIVGNIRNAAGTLVKPSQTVASGTSGALTIDLAGLGNGTYNLRYNAVDTAGNMSATKSFDFTIDNTAPTATVKPESIGSDGIYQRVSFKLFDAGKVDKVAINGVVKDLSNSTYSDLNGVKPGVFGAVEGLNTLEVFDVAGNVTVVTFTLDTTGPTLAVKPEGTTGADGIYQKVSYKLFDNAKVVKAILNGVEKPLTPNKYSDLNGIVPGTFGAVEGLNTLVLVDALGNQSTHTFTLDTTKPVINVPAGGEWVNGVHSWTITQDEANPAKTYVEIQQLVNGKWKKFAGTWFYNTNVFEASFDTTGLSDNVATQIKISTWDKVNLHSSATFSVQVDNAAPTITVKPESIGSDGVYSAASFKLFDALSGVDKAFVNDVEKDLTNNRWSDLNNLKPGRYGAVEGVNTIVVQDVAGNTASLTITLDVTAPTVVDQVHEWQTKDGGRDSITLTFSESVTGLPQGWYGSGTTWTKAFYNTKPHTVTFVDQAGNEGTYTVIPDGAPVPPEDPTVPEEPETPEVPTDPEEPEMPSDPEVPTDPEDPTEPSNPDDTTEEPADEGDDVTTPVDTPANENEQGQGDDTKDDEKTVTPVKFTSDKDAPKQAQAPKQDELATTGSNTLNVLFGGLLAALVGAVLKFKPKLLFGR